MLSALRTLTLVILTLELAACASPRYQSVYRYEAPTDTAGRTCLEGCARKMAECREQCTTANQACLKNLEPLLDERHNEALKRYEMELDRYRQELVHYDLSLSLNWGHPSPWRRGFWPYSPWAMPYYFPPAPPVKPSRSAEFNRLRHERCDMDCGCQPIYDACFLACGGRKIPEVQCISNCPP
ncbi:MAG: hypothetical protein Q8O38_17335 [Sulfurimicrobium sp.]|nr:hypothetical protein [Sulfurimicrobium sp.]